MAVWPACAWAAIFYIAASGSDTNNGTSKYTPWLHAPGMAGCSGTPYAYTPQPGDSFILRGGDTWYPSGAGTPIGLPWSWYYGWNGTIGSPIYIGVDKTWYSGASWARPVLSGGNPLSASYVASCAYHVSPLCYDPVSSHRDNGQACTGDNGCYYGDGQCGTAFLKVHWAQNITVDNIEFTGACSDVTKDETYLITSQNGNPQPQGNVYENLYMHGWTMTELTADQQNDGVGFSGASQGAGNNQFIGNTVDGSDSYPYGFAGQLWDCFDVHNSTFRYIGQGLVCDNGHLFYNNLIEYIYESTKPGEHSNGLEYNSMSIAAGTNLVYDNIVRHCTTAVTTWIVPEPGMTTYVYNNLLYDNAQQSMDVSGEGSGAPSGTAYFINNTIESGVEPAFGGVGGLTTGTNYLWNNHCINTAGTCANGANQTNLTNLMETQAQAAAAGYTAANLYAPTSASSPTVGQGTNESSYFTLDRPGVSRPLSGAWDIGAYQYITIGPPPPTGV